MIRFSPHQHQYRSLDPDNQIDWIGITSLIEAFKPPFLSVPQSIKSSKNSRSKWYKMDPERIREIWKRESMRSLTAGSWYHHKTEQTINQDENFIHQDTTLKVIKPTYVGEEKYASSQKLEEGYIYPEHMVYLQTHGVCGQTDRVHILNNLVNIRDYKTSKAIKMEGYTNWEGFTARMLSPLEHLDDCDFVHHSLQLSLYLYTILRHNPLFKPGKLILDHIIFEIESTDEYGYPVYRKDDEGGFIIQDVKEYQVTYLRSEVIQILSFLEENRQVIKDRIKIHKEQ